MAGWRRKAAWMAALLLALAGLLPVLAHALFDGERLKAMAQERVRQAWSRELRIDKLELRLLPRPALRASGVSLANPPWARQAHLADIGLLEARLSWRALLAGRIAPGALLVRDARLQLEQAEDGRRSWDLQAAAQHRGAMDWNQWKQWTQLTRIALDDVDVTYCSAGAAPRNWRIAALSAAAEPGWRHVQLEASVQSAGLTMAVSAALAKSSQAGAGSEADIRASWPASRLSIRGRLPLLADGAGLDAKLELESRAPAELLRFFLPGRIAAAEPEPSPAPLSLRATLGSGPSGLLASDLALRLGATEIAGELRLRRAGPVRRLQLEGRLASPAIDWRVFARDAGLREPAPVPPLEMFRRSPLPWRSLEALGDLGIDSALDLHAASFRLRNGILLSDARLRLAGRGDALDATAFSMKLLGGSASGSLRLDGGQHSAQLKLAAEGVLLERWFSERGRKLPVSGGPMQISAAVQGHGASLRDIAASLDGLITVRGGRTVIRSEKAAEAESLLTNMLPAFSERGAPRMTLECFAGRLPFVRGRAAAVAGARSDVSQLLATGPLDLGSQSLDLHGRVRGRHGIALGIASVGGDVGITGPIRKPHMALDPAGTPAALARLGAAIVTGGVSLLATAAWDAANPASDPCQAVFRHGGGNRGSP